MQFQSKHTIQCNFKEIRQSNAISKQADNPKQSQSKQTIQCKFKLQIYWALRVGHWALVAWQTRCVICLKHVDTRLNHNKYILFYHHLLYNKQCWQKDEPQKYHIVIQYAITICAKCNVWTTMQSQYVQSAMWTTMQSQWPKLPADSHGQGAPYRQRQI